MAATTSSATVKLSSKKAAAAKAEAFIKTLARDYPQYKFKAGAQEHWSPRYKTVIYNPQQSLQELHYGVLHELAHALLGHADYSTDIELVKMEADAWEMATEIAHRYHINIAHEHIQNCLDTYRDWLHQRSACPSCGMHVLQKDSANYHCFNCQTEWKVSSGRFVRPYRRSVK